MENSNENEPTHFETHPAPKLVVAILYTFLSGILAALLVVIMPPETVEGKILMYTAVFILLSLVSNLLGQK